MKGVCVLKEAKRGKWADVFNTWLGSKHPALIVHCKDSKEQSAVYRAAIYYQQTREVDILMKKSGLDVRLYRHDLDDEYAMQVRRDEKGVVYFYDGSKGFRRV